MLWDKGQNPCVGFSSRYTITLKEHLWHTFGITPRRWGDGTQILKVSITGSWKKYVALSLLYKEREFGQRQRI